MEGEQKNATLSLFNFIFPLIKPYYGWFCLDMGCLLFSAVLPVLNAYFLGKVIDSALAAQYRGLWINLIILTIFTLINIVVAYLTRFAYANYGAMASKDLRNNIAQKISRLPVSYMENNHSGDISSRMLNDTFNVQIFLEGDFSIMLTNPLKLLGICLYMFYLDWKMMALCMAIIPVSIFLSNRVSRPMKRESKKFSEHKGKVNSMLQDTIGGMTVIKAYNLEQSIYERFREMLGICMKDNLKMIKMWSMLSPVRSLMNVIPTVSCVMYGGYLSIKGVLSPGSMMTSLQLIGFATWAAAGIPNSLMALKQLSGSVERITELLNQPEEESGTYTGKSEQDIDPLVFDKVSFSYDSKIQILDKMSFSVPEGKTTALVGPSGTGKTTVVKLMSSFYLPQCGSIYLYGKDIKEWKLSTARSMLSLVSQDTYLYPATIEENIAYGCPGAKFEDIEKAAKAADAHEFIMTFTQGYRTVVGERGIRLSGGQKQRIAIARAFLKNSPIILLDEPTSALDSVSEAHVQAAVENLSKGKTVFVIAHRLSTIKNADIVMVMNEGHIEEMGTHKELMDKGGLYRQLYYKQFSAQESINIEIEEGA